MFILNYLNVLDDLVKVGCRIKNDGIVILVISVCCWEIVDDFSKFDWWVVVVFEVLKFLYWGFSDFRCSFEGSFLFLGLSRKFLLS